MKEIVSRITKGAAFFASGTVVSRISGFFRDVCTAALLGATSELALFFIAFRFANVFRRLLAETPLTSSALPYVEKHQDKQKIFMQLTGSGFLVVTSLVILTSSCFFMVREKVSSDWKVILDLTSIMMPSLLFLVGTGINTIFLQLQRNFFPIGVSSTLCNLIWIGVLPFASVSRAPEYILAWGVLGGFMLQYIFTLYFVWRGYRFSIWKKEYSLFSEIRPIIIPFLLSLGGIAATQVNNAIDPIFAKSALAEAPAYLWYAVRVYLLPISVIGIAFFTASFPELTRLWNGGDRTQFIRIVEKSALALTAFFIPLSVFIVFCAEDICTILYYRGAFSLNDVVITSRCLQAYSIGLCGSVLVLFFSNVYFAKGEYRWPALMSALSVVCNIVLNWIFVFVLELGAPSVAFATALSAWCNALFLKIPEVRLGIGFSGFASLAAFLITTNMPSVAKGRIEMALLHAVSSFVVFSMIYLLLYMGKRKAESR